MEERKRERGKERGAEERERGGEGKREREEERDLLSALHPGQAHRKHARGHYVYIQCVLRMRVRVRVRLRVRVRVRVRKHIKQDRYSYYTLRPTFLGFFFTSYHHDTHASILTIRAGNDPPKGASHA